MEYQFTLHYRLAEDDQDFDAIVDKLGEAGCMTCRYVRGYLSV